MANDDYWADLVCDADEATVTSHTKLKNGRGFIKPVRALVTIADVQLWHIITAKKEATRNV